MKTPAVLLNEEQEKESAEIAPPPPPTLALYEDSVENQEISPGSPLPLHEDAVSNQEIAPGSPLSIHSNAEIAFVMESKGAVYKLVFCYSILMLALKTVKFS